jgi:hypothetical protein
MSKIAERLEECSLQASQVFKNLTGEKDANFKTLKSLIDKKREKFPKFSALKNGVIVFKNLIVKRLNKLREKMKDPYASNQILKRIDYFRSSECTKNFMKELTVDTKKKGDTDKKAETIEYAEFFNVLFGFVKKEKGKRAKATGIAWRALIEDGTPPQTQCEKSIYGLNERIVNKKGQSVFVNTKCYICGDSFRLNTEVPKYHKPECEHLLPVALALCHLWLVDKDKYDDLDVSVKRLIKKEYAWAHACCNRTKSNRSMIRVLENGKYEVNMKAIPELLTDIQSKANYDCKYITIKNFDDRLNRLTARFTSIVEIINESVEHYGEDYYPIYIRYKLLCAFSDDVFDEIIKGKKDYKGGDGDENDGDTIENTIPPEEAFVNALTTDELTEDMISDIEEYMKEIESKPEEFFESKYYVQTREFIDENGETTKEKIYLPKQKYDEIVYHSKRTDSIAPPLPAKGTPYTHSTYIEEDNTWITRPIGENPWGNFDNEKKRALETDSETATENKKTRRSLGGIKKIIKRGTKRNKTKRRSRKNVL